MYNRELAKEDIVTEKNPLQPLVDHRRACHTCTVSSKLPEAIRVLSGDQITEVTPCKVVGRASRRCAQPRRDRSSRLCLALERDSLWE